MYACVPKMQPMHVLNADTSIKIKYNALHTIHHEKILFTTSSALILSHKGYNLIRKVILDKIVADTGFKTKLNTRGTHCLVAICKYHYLRSLIFISGGLDTAIEDSNAITAYETFRHW